MDAVKEYFLQNWVLLIILGAFAVVLFISAFSNKRTTIRYFILLVAIFILSIIVFVEFYIEPVSDTKIARLILMSIRYSYTPIIIGLIIMVSIERQKLYIFIPAALLLILNIVSIFTGIVFGINDANELVRGPLGYAPFIVCALYMVYLIYFLIKRSNKRLIEIIPIAFLGFTLITGVILPFVFGTEFSKIFCTIIAASLFIYYVFNILELTKKDALTGLLNRQAFYIETRRSHKDITATISIDMNGLKNINDKYGHAAGDEALVTLALCFSSSVKVKQSVYRMGGDEFIIVCRKTSKEEVINLVDKITQKVKETKYTCAIGYSYLEGDIKTLDDLLKESDRRMYVNKVEFHKNI